METAGLGSSRSSKHHVGASRKPKMTALPQYEAALASFTSSSSWPFSSSPLSASLVFVLIRRQVEF
jgi:hypothetical protein